MELVALLQKQGVAENVKVVIEKIVASALPALINPNLEVGVYLQKQTQIFLHFGSIINQNISIITSR